MKDTKKKEQEIIDQIINLLKFHPIVEAMFRNRQVPISEIDNIPIEFKDLDVSAKAKGGKIYINRSFLEDDNILDHIPYFVHELTHILQQKTGNVSDSSKCKHYLDDNNEIEAFHNQILFIKKYKDEDQARDYLNDLLDFHELSGAKRKDKYNQLWN